MPDVGVDGRARTRVRARRPRTPSRCPHFTSEDLTTVHKADGTPVAQVDFDTEQAILDVLRRERPTDSVVGEEVGPQPGNAARRWILDGIDGTHNFSLGRPGWATAIALEVDGEIVVALLSAPALGRRWWAVRGGGAWTASVSSDTAFDAAAAEPIHVGGATSLASASVIVIPSEGFVVGWRDEVTRRFPMPTSPRSQTWCSTP